jgi:succinate dehydrogenase flavin-adding protein (antitoxin of CptAB toxin-antitoxin module)
VRGLDELLDLADNDLLDLMLARTEPQGERMSMLRRGACWN